MTNIDQNYRSNFTNLLRVSFYVYGIMFHLLNSSKSAGIVKRTGHSSKKGQGLKNTNILVRYYYETIKYLNDYLFLPSEFLVDFSSYINLLDPNF